MSKPPCHGERVRPPSRHPPGRARAALVLVGLLLPLLGLELALRLFGPVLPGNYNVMMFNDLHPVYGFFHRPGATGWVRSSEFTTHVRINSRGLRGEEWAEEKPPGVYRILVLGDSAVEGIQVDEELTICRQLERLLNARQDGRTYEVLNGGVAGWGTGQEYLFLREEGVKYAPDLVVVFFSIGNDVTDNAFELGRGDPIAAMNRPHFRLDEAGQLLATLPAPRPPDPLLGLRQALRDVSYAYNFVESGVVAKIVYRQIRGEGNLRREPLYLKQTPPEYVEAWRLTEALLGALRATAASVGAETVLVTSPSNYQIYDRLWRALAPSAAAAAAMDREQPNQILAEVTARQGIHYLDILPAFRERVTRYKERLNFPKDGHKNPRGQAFTAELIAEFLARQVFPEFRPLERRQGPAR